jgi:hypothetical protein
MKNKNGENLLTTGEVSGILGLSQQTVIRLCDNGVLEHKKDPSNRRRNIAVKGLIDFVDLHSIPKLMVLSNLEKREMNPNEFGIDGLVGNGMFQFHTPTKLYTTGQAAQLLQININSVIRGVDCNRLGGYRIPINGKFRMITADAIARTFDSGNFPFELIPHTTISLDYPNGWEGCKENSLNGKSISYRSNNNIQEISYRSKNTGLYLLEENQRTKLFLLGTESPNYTGEILPRKEHLSRIYQYLVDCNSHLRKDKRTEDLVISTKNRFLDSFEGEFDKCQNSYMERPKHLEPTYDEKLMLSTRKAKKRINQENQRI